MKKTQFSKLNEIVKDSELWRTESEHKRGEEISKRGIKNTK